MEEYERQNIERYFETLCQNLDTLLSLISESDFNDRQIQELSRALSSEVSEYFDNFLIQPIRRLDGSQTNQGQIETEKELGDISRTISQADFMTIKRSIQEIFYCFKEIPALLDTEKARLVLEKHPKIVETISSLISRIESARKARQR